jgi:hypothetical protein
VTLSRGGRVAGLVALALLASGQGCGGGGGDGTPVPDVPRVPQSFEFTVTVPGATATLGDPRFFSDQSLTRINEVELGSTAGSLGTVGASVSSGQQRVSPIPQPFNLVVHFDASGSIDNNGRDPDPDGPQQPGEPRRFPAARGLIAGVGGSNPARVYTFRSLYSGAIKLMSPSDFPASDGGAAGGAVEMAKNEGADGNSPALTATFNIINQLPSSGSGMLLLTDGENNAEDPQVVPNCGGNEGQGGSACNNISNVVALAQQKNVRVYVAGLGNEDSDLSKFRNLAEDTGGAYVKATRATALESQFAAIGQLMKSGGVVVTGETETIPVPPGSNPKITGFLRFNRPASGTCPGGSVPVTLNGNNYCRLAFGQ